MCLGASSIPIKYAFYILFFLIPSSKSSEIERRERAKSKRDKILAIEAEKRLNPPVSDMDANHIGQNDFTVTKALQALDENFDEVKRMNQLIALAKVQTILEVQREEKERLRDGAKRSERMLEERLEKERLRAIELEQESEQKKIDEQRRKSHLILEQIKERETMKIIEEEAKMKERLWLQRKREKELEEEQKKLEEKQRIQKEHFNEILNANEESIRRAAELKALAKAEDLKLLEYQRDLAAKERELEEREVREAAEREHEISKLRANQERSKNKEAELDALRAKRSLEAAERAALEKERLAKEAQMEINASLAHARKVQQAEKQMALLEHAREERKEFDILAQTQARLQAAEILKQQEENRRRSEHANELQAQIRMHSERKNQARQDMLEEGNLIRARQEAERNRLNKVRQTKLENLLKSGVPEKHCLNLRKALKS